MAGKWLIRALAVPVLALGLVGGAWHVALERLETELAAWSVTRQAEGWGIAHSPPERGGFPFRPELRVERAALTSPAGFAWRAERLALRLDPLDPLALHLLPAGAQAVQLAGRLVPVEAEGARLRIPLARGEVALRAESLAAEGVAASDVDVRLVGWRLDGRAGRLAAPGMPELQEAVLEAESNAGLLHSAAAFRAAGGLLRIARLSARSGEATAELRGDFTLDAALQPEGEGTLAVSNPREAIAILSGAGLIPGDLARPLGALALLTARRPAPGEPPRLALPFTLRESRLVAGGRLTLLVLPPIGWR